MSGERRATYAAIAAFPLNMAIIALVFGALGAGSSWVWMMFGAGLRHFLRTPRALRILNIAMGLLPVASLVPVVLRD